MKIRVKRYPSRYVGLQGVSLPFDVEAEYADDDAVYISYANMQKVPGFRWEPGDTDKEGDNYIFQRKDSYWWPLRSIAILVGEEGAKDILLDQQKRSDMEFTCKFCGHNKKGVWMKRISTTVLDKPYNICYSCAENFDNREKWDEAKNDILWSAFCEEDK